MSTQLENLENRMDRVERVLSSAGDLLLQATAAIRSNAEAIDGLTQKIDTLTNRVDGIAEKMDVLTDRVNSLAASNEQHERILDYLLRREQEQ
jgi:chromosome segregation ATPase